MKLIILAFILSLTLHFLFFFPYSKKEVEKSQKQRTSKHIKKSKVHYVKLMAPKPSQNKTNPLVKKEEMKPIIKKEPIKKYIKVKKNKIIPQKKKIVKKPKKIIPKPIKKAQIKPQLKKVTPIKPQEKRKTIPKKSLENFFLSEPVPLNIDMLDEITKKYIKAYGDEYEKLTKVQKVFVQNNIKIIANITRKYYRFPRLAKKLRLNDFNVVEFTLYPNGDMTDLKIRKKGEYSFYDKSIIEAIEVAYKDFPRPKVPTKIIFSITYEVR